MPYKDIEKKRECQRRWYSNPENQAKHLANMRLRQKKAVLYVRRIKEQTPCSCGESHVACLDFHHRDPSQKKGNVMILAASGASIRSLDAEIDKCDVLCANCHRKLHWAQDRTMNSDEIMS